MSARDHSRQNNGAENDVLKALPDIPRDDDGPVFGEPWQAEVFSMTCLLHEKGVFSWSDWADTLGAVIREMPDDTEYYHCWLTALERITVKQGLTTQTSLAERKIAWDKAARATPHGQPIELIADEHDAGTKGDV